MQSLFETYINELKSAVRYNAYYISKPILAPEDYADIFKRDDTPIGIYLRDLKAKLKDHYNEDLAKEIYNSCFCLNRKSSFSIHMRVQREMTENPLDIYIDTDRVACLLETGFKKPNSITLDHPTKGIYNPEANQTGFYSPFYRSDIRFYFKVQPEFEFIDDTQNNLIPQRNTYTNWSWVLRALLLISICVSAYNGMIALLAISLLLLLLSFVISRTCDNTVRMANHSNPRFFHSTDGSQPDSAVESSEHQQTLNPLVPEPIDILDFFKDHFSGNRVEELDDNESTYSTYH